MKDINILIKERDDILEEIKFIENQTGIENKKQFNQNKTELETLYQDNVNRILSAINKQQHYYFKNKPKIFMDKLTGVLWANLDYFEYRGRSKDNLPKILEEICLDEINTWTIPKGGDFAFMLSNENGYHIKFTITNWRDTPVLWYYGDGGGSTSSLTAECILKRRFNSVYSEYSNLWPCSYALTNEDYYKNIQPDNKIYSEKERVTFTLDLFVKNNLETIFDDDEITQLYKMIYIQKPLLIKNLNKINEEIKNTQQIELLSSTFDYNTILSKYDIGIINKSVIKYYKSVISVVDELMKKMNYYEKVKIAIVCDFNTIGLELSKKYEDNCDLTNAENNLLRNRQEFFKKHFKLGMNVINSRLLSLKKQAESIEDRIEDINDSQSSINELFILENEQRPTFNLFVENSVDIVKNALIKIEFFEQNKMFCTKIISLLNRWTEDYKIFKTTSKSEFENICKEDSIESELYNAWYDEWQKKRFVIEERFLPLVEFALKGELIDTNGNDPTIIEKVIVLLQNYKDGVDKFYKEERKNIHQKFAFQSGGNLQEKFESEAKLYNIMSSLQIALQTIIFSIEKTENKLFLLKWADVFLDLQIDDIVDFIKNNELSNISVDILNEFVKLKIKTLDIYISDSKSYGKELERREKEYNSLIFKIRKDLMKK